MISSVRLISAAEPAACLLGFYSKPGLPGDACQPPLLLAFLAQIPRSKVPAAGESLACCILHSNTERNLALQLSLSEAQATRAPCKASATLSIPFVPLPLAARFEYCRLGAGYYTTQVFEFLQDLSAKGLSETLANADLAPDQSLSKPDWAEDTDHIVCTQLCILIM